MPFLESLTAGAGEAVGSNIVGTAVGALTGAYKGRPQWRDIEFMNDVANRLTPDEASRQNQFLDLTYGEDTRRLTERIQGMGKELGMSPWELTGTPSATPMGAPQNASSEGRPAQAFMGQLVPLQIAKLNANTQLQTAAMQNDTQKQIAGVKPQKGSQQEAQVALTKAIEMLTYDQSAATQAQARLTQNTVFTNMIRIALDALPTTTTGLPGVTMTGKTGTFPILQGLKEASTGYKDDDAAFQKMLDQIVTSRAAQLKSELTALAKVAGDTAQSFGQSIMQFLPKMKK